MKKFEPWIQKADAKRAVGMLKPKNLQEALDQLEGANVSFSTKLLSFSLELDATLRIQNLRILIFTLSDQLLSKVFSKKKRKKKMLSLLSKTI